MKKKKKFSWENITGWLTKEEGTFLQKLAEGQNVLEIGCFYGRSTICMLEAEAQVITIDTFLAGRNGQDQNGYTFGNFLENLLKSGLKARLGILPLPSSLAYLVLAINYLSFSSFFPHLNLPFRRVDGHDQVVFDLVFIDGCHDEYDVRMDLRFLEYVEKYVVLHDYGVYPGVTKACLDFFGRIPDKLVGSLAIYDKTISI